MNEKIEQVIDHLRGYRFAIYSHLHENYSPESLAKELKEIEDSIQFLESIKDIEGSK